MIVEIISKYLEQNKRLVVPNLGAFIVKVAGQTILFSNLIKNDDGVLRSLVAASGLSELEAAGAVDRFVFEVNFRLEQSEVCRLTGFGELKKGVNGTITFSYQPTVEGENLDANLSERMAERAAQEAAKPVVESAEEEVQADFDIVPSKSEEPASEPTQSAEPALEAKSEPKSPASPATHSPQGDYVKGLRYGKGRKVVTGREGATSRRSNKGDLIMKIAIGAALIAILALAYGFYNDWRNAQYMYSGDADIYPTEPTTAEPTVENPDLEYITPNEN